MHVLAQRDPKARLRCGQVRVSRSDLCSRPSWLRFHLCPPEPPSPRCPEGTFESPALPGDLAFSTSRWGDTSQGPEDSSPRSLPAAGSPQARASAWPWPSLTAAWAGGPRGAWARLDGEGGAAVWVSERFAGNFYKC